MKSSPLDSQLGNLPIELLPASSLLNVLFGTAGWRTLQKILGEPGQFEGGTEDPQIYPNSSLSLIHSPYYCDYDGELHQLYGSKAQEIATRQVKSFMELLGLTQGKGVNTNSLLTLSRHGTVAQILGVVSIEIKALMSHLPDETKKLFLKNLAFLRRDMSHRNFSVAVTFQHFLELLDTDGSGVRGDLGTYRSFRDGDNGLCIKSSFQFYAEYGYSNPFNTSSKGKSPFYHILWNECHIPEQTIFGIPPSREVLLQRQSEIESLVGSLALYDIRKALQKRPDTSQLEDAFSPFSDPHHHISEGYMQCYVKGDEYRKELGDEDFTSFFERDDSPENRLYENILELPRHIVSFLSQSKAFLDICSKVPSWAGRVDILRQYIEEIEPFFSGEFLFGGHSVEEFAKREERANRQGRIISVPSGVSQRERAKIASSYDFLFAIIEQLDSEFEYFFRMLSLAYMVQSERWSKVSFDNNRPFAYIGGRHIAKWYNQQVPNPSFADTPITIISGANNSGKSYGLQRDLMIRRAAQTLGWAPVESGNFPDFYDMIIYLDRPSSHGSAFANEIKQIKEALRLAQGKKVLLYIDEPFSTTAPSDQGALIAFLIEKIVSGGGRIVLTTHNITSADDLRSHYGDNVEFYHYDVTLIKDADGNIASSGTRMLRQGLADSQSLLIAESAGAPSDFIERTQEYPSGESRQLVYSPRMPLPLISLSEDRIREISQREGLAGLFHGEDTRFNLYSIDFATFARSDWISDMIKGTDLENLIDISELRDLVSRMVFFAPRVEMSELLEKQKLFEKLAQDRRYLRILESFVPILYIEHKLYVVLKSKDKLSERLNPFSNTLSDSERLRGTSKKRNEIEMVRMYLSLYKDFFTLGNQDEVDSFLRELDNYKQFVDIYDNTETLFVQRGEDKYAFFEYTERSFIKRDTPPGADAFIAVANNAFREYVPSGFSSLQEIGDYFVSINKKASKIAKDMPNLSLATFMQDIKTREWLIQYLGEFGEDYSARNPINRPFFGTNLFGAVISEMNSQSDPKELIRSLLDFMNFETAYHTAKELIGEIQSPYIASSIEFMGKQYRNFCHMIEQGEFSLSIEGVHVESPLTDEINRLSALCLYAAAIDREYLYPVQFSPTGTLHIPHTANRFICNSKEAIVGNPFEMQTHFPCKILTGPNMSGKTFFAQSGTGDIVQALNTGYCFSPGAVIPFFDRVIYVDRVNEQDGESGSFVRELQNWKGIWKMLESGEKIFLASDEMFSTVSETYQGAFSHTVLTKSLENGAYVLTASHHHGWVDMLQTTTPGLDIAHFGFILDEKGINFTRVLETGHAPSHPREVAKLLGFY